MQINAERTNSMDRRSILEKGADGSGNDHGCPGIGPSLKTSRLYGPWQHFPPQLDAAATIHDLACIPDIKANDPVALHTEDVRHSLVLQAMTLPLQRPAIQIEYLLDHLD
jgi:hypothetical protein